MEKGNNTSHNGMSFSLAWFNNNSWKTYYRKFHLSFNKKLYIKEKKILNGQYPQNLYFDEKINLKDCKFMVYAVPTDISYKKISDGFKNNNFDFMLFKDTFILDKSKWDIYSPNLKFFKNSLIHLYGKSNNQLQVTIYKTQDILRVTLPVIHIKNIPDRC